MKKLILGSSGFIGSNLVNDLGGIGITRDNYQSDSCDILINSCGNSKKYLPEKDPLTDFDQSVRTTLQSVVDFSFDTYILISSCEVYNGLTNEETTIDVSAISRYGLSKYLAECIVKQYCKKWIILRLNGPIGPNMKKGPVYDILNNSPIWMSAKSEFQFLHVKFISKFIKILLDNKISNEVFNLTGSNVISLTETMNILGKKVASLDNKVIKHSFNVEKANKLMALPTSLESIKGEL
jgi:nucleoside-diphosphate-sugar epimerase